MGFWDLGLQGEGGLIIRFRMYRLELRACRHE